jgi:competence protein ComEA
VIAALLLASSALAAPLDVNTASAQQLDTLPGVGRSKAQAIIAHREAHGPFPDVSSVAAVSGIGPGTMRAIRGRVVAGDVVLASAHPSPNSQEARHPVVPSAVTLDPNSAGVVALAALPGISGIRAEAIVADRERNGPFSSCADLVRVPGIGPATLAALRGLCDVGI